MLMHNPPHPGKAVKRTLLDGLNLSVTEAAKALGVGRITLSRLINGHVGISPEMAVRLSMALNTSSELLASGEEAKKLKIKPIVGKLAVVF